VPLLPRPVAEYQLVPPPRLLLVALTGLSHSQIHQQSYPCSKPYLQIAVSHYPFLKIKSLMPLQNLMRIPQNNSFEVFSRKTQKTSATKNLCTKKIRVSRTNWTKTLFVSIQ
jgi:hypothetical protein